MGHNLNQYDINQDRVVGTGMVAPGIYKLTNTLAQEAKQDMESSNRIYGLFADVTLGYKNWAFLNMTARNDWASVLPKQNRSGAITTN